MRTSFGVLLVVGILTLSGCQALTGKGGRGASASPASAKQGLFMGNPGGSSSNSPSAAGSSDPANLTSAAGPNSDPRPTQGAGVLAGRVLDQENRLRPGAITQVFDLDGPRDRNPPLAVKANRQGYFDIDGLEVGRSYRLVARVKDGVRVLVGSRRVVPHDIRVTLYLTDELPGAEDPNGGSPSPTGSIPSPPGTPSTGTIGFPPRPGEGDGGSTETMRSPTLPPAVSTNPALPSSPSGDPSQIAKDGGYNTPRSPSPVVNIPSGNDHKPEKPLIKYDSRPGDLMPSLAPAATLPTEPISRVESIDNPSSEPIPSPRPGIPPLKTVVPSCVRLGNTIENFTLYDVNGAVYEFARARTGRLILLDFGYCECLPCRRAIGTLNKWHEKYSKRGLEIIGISYEVGTLQEKQQSLEYAKKKYRLSFAYRVLFGGGGEKGNCPVADQLRVSKNPTLILLDGTGRILMRAEGLDEYTEYQLEMEIYRKLIKTQAAVK